MSCASAGRAVTVRARNSKTADTRRQGIFMTAEGSRKRFDSARVRWLRGFGFDGARVRWLRGFGFDGARVRYLRGFRFEVRGLPRRSGTREVGGRFWISDR